jgi:DNA helicase-2/ATP-dependent DNA helicase PcrA
VVAALGLDDSGTDGDVLLRWPLAAEELPAVARPHAEALARAIQPSDGETPGNHAERLLDALAPLVEAGYDDGPARLADLDALVVAAHGAARLSDVAADVAIEPPRSTSDLAGPPVVDEDWLVISTVHSAKGLEWDVVHLMRAADGNFPSDMALGDREGLEEERRLFYVATTRPRRHLHVYLPLRFHLRPGGRDDAHVYGQPSRFLSDEVLAGFDQQSVGHREAEPIVRLDAGAVVGVELDALWS